MDFEKLISVPFSEEQQRLSESRIVHVGTLIREGARINTLGQLVVTTDQIQTLADSETEVYERQIWLNTPIQDIVQQIMDSPKTATRMSNVLLRGGIRSRKDLLVAGRSRLRDIQGFGDKSLELISESLHNDFGVDLQDNPTPRYIASFCRNLSEVNALALGYGVLSNEIYKNDRFVEVRSLSVQDILDGQEVGGSYLDMDQVLLHTYAAKIFARSFSSPFLSEE